MFTLSARYGGGLVGLLSHYVIAPVTRAAANEAAGKAMNKIFQRLAESPEVVEEGPFMTQRARCEKIGEDQSARAMVGTNGG